jgi:hypothetical protein
MHNITVFVLVSSLLAEACTRVFDSQKKVFPGNLHQLTLLNGFYLTHVDGFNVIGEVKTNQSLIFEIIQLSPHLT